MKKTNPPLPVEHAHRGLNRNLLILGTLTLLTLGGLGIFIASKMGGNTHNTKQNTANQIINNSYFTQLIASGAATEKDLNAVTDISPYGEGFIGISKEQLAWEQGRELARRTGSEILVVNEVPREEGEKVVAWLAQTFSENLKSSAWVQRGDQPGVLAGTEILGVKQQDERRKAILHWHPAKREHQSVIVDPPSNLNGDTTRAFMDILETTIRSEGGNYVLEAVVAGPFPSPSTMAGGKRFDFIWFIDIDKNRNTGQSEKGNDYNIHLFLAETGWDSAWYKVSSVSEGDGIAIARDEFQIRISGRRACLTFPKRYLPTKSFEMWATCFSGNAPHWPPLTENPPTRNATCNF